jgi:MerR family mercuric resistance operon transcriptional regulator
MRQERIPIGELSRQTGNNIETIRYYERIGLVPAPPRQGRYRSYGPEDVGRLRFVWRARRLGFTLDEVRALLRLAKGGQKSCSAARSLASAHLADVKAKIADLRRMERVLADAVRACDSGNLSDCPLIESLYVPG